MSHLYTEDIKTFAEVEQIEKAALGKGALIEYATKPSGARVYRILLENAPQLEHLEEDGTDHYFLLTGSESEPVFIEFFANLHAIDEAKDFAWYRMNGKHVDPTHIISSKDTVNHLPPELRPLYEVANQKWATLTTIRGRLMEESHRLAQLAKTLDLQIDVHIQTMDTYLTAVLVTQGQKG